MTNYQGGAPRASLKCSENERRNNDEKTTKICGKIVDDVLRFSIVSWGAGGAGLGGMVGIH